MSEAEDRFELALADVAAGTGPASPHLSALSHLTREQTRRFEPLWRGLDEQQKLSLLRALSVAEEASLRLEFNEVYHVGLLDDSPRVRQQSMESIVEDSSAWLRERLLTLLVDDPESSVRTAATAALGAVAQRAELGEMPPEAAAEVRRVLLQTLHRPGESSAVRAGALAALGYFSDEQVQREIEAAYGQAELRLAALQAMGHSADPAWVETLNQQLQGSDETARLAAARAAGEIGAEAAVRVLADLVDDPSIPLRLEVLTALGKIGGEEAREALLYALEDKRPAVRERALAALGELESNEDPLGF
jgi:HEAT repeat protein